MDADTESRRSFTDRFIMLKNRMCQISKEHDVWDDRYSDYLVDELRELGLGCLVEAFPPSRMPSCARGENSYVAACCMDIIDLNSSLIMRFSSRLVGKDYWSLNAEAMERVFENAGMRYTDRFPEFRFTDILVPGGLGTRIPVTQDVPYVTVCYPSRT